MNATTATISQSTATRAGWIASCAVAETIGMTAAAGAARVGEGLPVAASLALIVLAGLVEGAALGALQARWLGRRFIGFSRQRWVVATIVVAGLGWASASAPAALSDGSGAVPPWIVLIGAALGLGVAMGALLGTAQAWAFRGSVRHPWRWIGISALAWAPTMAIIFVGATVPDAAWPTSLVITMGAITGGIAGSVLGMITYPLIPALTERSLSSSVVAWALHHGAPGLGASLALLRVTGRRSGRVIELPVQYAREGGTIIVLPGNPERKNWWRNLRSRSDVAVWLDERWRSASAIVVQEGSAGFEEALAVYSTRWSHAGRAAVSTLVRIDLDPSG